MSASEDFETLKVRRTERLKQLAQLTSGMRPDHITFANNIIDGMNSSDAFRHISPRYQDDPYAKSRGPSLKKREDIVKYIDLMKTEAIDSAMNRVQFTEEDWLRRQLQIQAKALGEIKIKKAFLVGGEIVEEDVFEDNLAQANKTQELLGKRFGLLTDVKVENNRTTLTIKDMTGRKKVKAKS